MSALVRRLTPAIQTRVARRLMQTELRYWGDVRREVEDLTQEVFVSLFAREGTTLLGWSPDAGASLETFVGIVAERLVVTVLRSRRQSPLQQRSQDPATFDGRAAERSSVDASIAARDTLTRIAEGLRSRLSERALEMFHALFIMEESVPELCARTGQTAEAIYQWRSRLKKLILELAAAEAEEPGALRASAGSYVDGGADAASAPIEPGAVREKGPSHRVTP